MIHSLLSTDIDVLAAFVTSIGNGTEVEAVGDGSGVVLGTGEGKSLGTGLGTSLGAGEGTSLGTGDGSPGIGVGAGTTGTTATMRPLESLVIAKVARDFTTAPFAFGTPICGSEFCGEDAGASFGESLLHATPRSASAAVAAKTVGRCEMGFMRFSFR
jgi:hypothetical protein